jgi:hypothetical protein
MVKIFISRHSKGSRVQTSIMIDFILFCFNIYGKKPKFQNLEAQTWNFFYKNAQKGTERWDQPKQILMPMLGLNAKKNAHPGVAMDRKKKCAEKKGSHSIIRWKKACRSEKRSR